VKTIRLSAGDKARLSRLKGKTGIPHWNTLCRWALIASLAEGHPGRGDQDLEHDRGLHAGTARGGKLTEPVGSQP